MLKDKGGNMATSTGQVQEIFRQHFGDNHHSKHSSVEEYVAAVRENDSKQVSQLNVDILQHLPTVSEVAVLMQLLGGFPARLARHAPRQLLEETLRGRAPTTRGFLHKGDETKTVLDAIACSLQVVSLTLFIGRRRSTWLAGGLQNKVCP